MNEIERKLISKVVIDELKGNNDKYIFNDIEISRPHGTGKHLTNAIQNKIHFTREVIENFNSVAGDILEDGMKRLSKELSIALVNKIEFPAVLDEPKLFVYYKSDIESLVMYGVIPYHENVQFNTKLYE